MLWTRNMHMHIQSANCLLFSKKCKKSGQGSGKRARYVYKLQCNDGTECVGARFYMVHVENYNRKPEFIVWMYCECGKTLIHIHTLHRVSDCTARWFLLINYLPNVYMFMCHNFTYSVFYCRLSSSLQCYFAWKLSFSLFRFGCFVLLISL